MSLAAGSRLGPFEIGRRLELPGLGEAYHARDHENDRDVAIHVLRTDSGQDPAVRERFEQDVRAAAARMRRDPLAIYLVGVDAHAVYVVSEPLSAAPLAGRKGPPYGAYVGRAFRARHALAAIIFLAVLVTGVALWRLRAPEPVSVDVRQPSASTVGEPPAAPVAAVPLPVLPEPADPAPVAEPQVTDEIAEPDVIASAPTAQPSVPLPRDPAPVAPPPPLTPPERDADRSAPPARDDRDTATLITESTVRATEFDLQGALDLLTIAATRGDAGAQVAALYIRGLLDARESFRQGGSAESLKPVHDAITTLGEISRGRPGAAEIARLMLHAAAAAAQSEREEMRLYVESATQMESLQQTAGLGGAPLVSAAELSGELWLQVHRYEDARRAYEQAAERAGSSLRILAGLARAARRLNDMPAACSAYRMLLDAWSARPGLPLEIAEARAYLGGCGM